MQHKDSIKNWLTRRKINDATISQFGILFDSKITIPICDEYGKFLFNKYRRNPFLPDTGPKYWYDKGMSAALFGAHLIKDKKTVVVCEGELDALVLWSANIPAVSSTGGAKTFKEPWAELLKDKEVFLCYDADLAGAQGMVRTLSMVPWAKVILLPTVTDIKDISDYYERGMDLRNLMASAKHYTDFESVHSDYQSRKGQWLSVLFHEEWMKKYHNDEDENFKPKVKPSEGFLNNLERAKAVPIESIMKVPRDKKVLCLFHNDSRPSMHIFTKNNTFYCFSCGKWGSVIDIIMERDGLSFTEAVKRLL